MILRIDRHASLPDNVRRIAGGYLDSAVDTLEHPDNLDKSVHDARKLLKRLRALIRLVRNDIGGETFRTENTAYRDAGRHIAGIRDSHVTLRTLENVLSGMTEKPGAQQLDNFRQLLNDRYDTLIRENLHTESINGALGILHTARERIGDWPLSGKGFGAIAPGLSRVYRMGRRAMKTAGNDPSDGNLHAWRKAAEHLRFQMDILRPLWKQVIGSYAKALKHLTGLTGRDHDLAVLTGRMTEYTGGSDDAAFNALEGEIDNRRSRLQRNAFKLGALVYAEKTGAFVERIGRYWEISFRD